jgi:hypothetical protein
MIVGTNSHTVNCKFRKVFSDYSCGTLLIKYDHFTIRKPLRFLFGPSYLALSSNQLRDYVYF